jgi:hypothetical protein
MKSLLVSFALLFSVAACSAQTTEPAKKPTTAVAEGKASSAPETKRVCKDVVRDGKPVKNKDGSVKQECRTIKIHKKHEGTKVPTK